MRSQQSLRAGVETPTLPTLFWKLPCQPHNSFKGLETKFRFLFTENWCLSVKWHLTCQRAFAFYCQSCLLHHPENAPPHLWSSSCSASFLISNICLSRSSSWNCCLWKLDLRYPQALLHPTRLPCKGNTSCKIFRLCWRMPYLSGFLDFMNFQPQAACHGALSALGRLPSQCAFYLLEPTTCHSSTSSLFS